MKTIIVPLSKKSGGRYIFLMYRGKSGLHGKTTPDNIRGGVTLTASAAENKLPIDILG